MIYNITPPEKNCINIDKPVNYYAQIITNISPSMIGIYDIIEEKSRNNKPRPYIFKEYMNTYDFGKIINSLFPSIPIIIYRSVKVNENYESIITDIQNNQLLFKDIVIVGNSLNTHINTNILIQKIKTECSVNIGSVLLYERPNEMERCMSRIKLGVSFFISQIVINPEKIAPFININLLPCKVYVTIIPITTVKTLEMVNWLGVNIDNFNLDNYPNELIKIKFENICFESISYIHSSNFIEFVRLFSY